MTRDGEAPLTPADAFDLNAWLQSQWSKLEKASAAVEEANNAKVQLRKSKKSFVATQRKPMKAVFSKPYSASKRLYFAR